MYLVYASVTLAACGIVVFSIIYLAKCARDMVAVKREDRYSESRTAPTPAVFYHHSPLFDPRWSGTLSDSHDQVTERISLLKRESSERK